jgi:small acid-soluble spore protein D (minor alpha/beta-type SASP)
MPRRGRNRLLIPEARRAMDQFQSDVMQREGYSTDAHNVKYEVAKQLGVPLEPGNNGQLTTEDAGKVGGKIGGAMVRDMIKLAQQQLNSK